MPTESTVPPKQLQDLTDEEIAKFAINFLASGKPLSELRGLTRENLDDFYRVGHTHYSAGNYAEAEVTFHALCLYDHRELRNWLAWGAACQMQGKLEAALNAYSFGQIMDLQSPEPAFHAFECHVALQNYPEAVCALETVVANCKDKKEHEALDKKAKTLLAELQSALRKAGA